MTRTKTEITEMRTKVNALLDDPANAGESSRLIAELAGCSFGFVQRLRKKREGTAYERRLIARSPIRRIRRRERVEAALSNPANWNKKVLDLAKELGETYYMVISTRHRLGNRRPAA